MKAGHRTTEWYTTAGAMAAIFVLASGGMHWGHSIALAVAAGAYNYGRARTKKGGAA